MVILPFPLYWHERCNTSLHELESTVIQKGANEMKKGMLRRMLSLVLVGMMLFTAAGCNTTAPTEPVNNDPGNGTEGREPTLPDADKLEFDFSFFEVADKQMPESQENYFNAAIRVALIGVVARFVLTPPVAAFALALHTIPSRQDDGSWIWVYTWVNGDEESQIRLRGMDQGDFVEWEFRIKALDADPPIDNKIWFAGETWNDGDKGNWNFHDPALADNPIVATLEWLHEGDEEELVFTDLNENPGNELAYRRIGDLHKIEFDDASTDDVWYIHLQETDGSGSLRDPEYKDGAEACWDEDQNDIACNPAS